MTPDERAKLLLLSHLSPLQREMFEAHSFFLVRGNNGEIYALRDGYYVYRVKRSHRDPHITETYGIIPTELGIRCDRLLAQKLLIESNSTYMLAKACRGHGRGTIPWLEQLLPRYLYDFIQETKDAPRRKWRRLRYWAMAWSAWWSPVP